MKIGSATYAVQAIPANLDEQLIAATGCDAREVAGMLADNPIAGLVANALAPFLKGKDIPSVPELAEAIADAGVSEIAPQVAALYASTTELEAPADE